jgi:hypothetical protein
MRISTFLLAVAFTTGIVTPSMNIAADPYCKPCPLNCDDLGLQRKHCEEIKGGRGLCCVELSDRGLEIVEAQDAALGNNNKAPQESCPPGFQVSERRCSDKERKNGCKDIRLNNGLGCVKR